MNESLQAAAPQLDVTWDLLTRLTFWASGLCPPSFALNPSIQPCCDISRLSEGVYSQSGFLFSVLVEKSSRAPAALPYEPTEGSPISQRGPRVSKPSEELRLGPAAEAEASPPDGMMGLSRTFRRSIDFAASCRSPSSSPPPPPPLLPSPRCRSWVWHQETGRRVGLRSGCRASRICTGEF